jgi:5-methylcytosine-specific restriction protein B
MDHQEYELFARKEKVRQIIEAQAADPVRMAEATKLQHEREAQRPEALAILREFESDRQVDTLRRALDKWGRTPAFQAFGGVNGQMFLNQLVDHSPDAGVLSAVLSRCLQPPADSDAAARAIDELASYAESIKTGAHPGPRRSMFFCSFIWSLYDPQVWPCFWKSMELALIGFGWHEAKGKYGAQYTRFRDTVLRLGDPIEVEWALAWFDNGKRFTGIDRSLPERCARNAETDRHFDDGAYDSAEVAELAERNAKAIIADLRYAGESLKPVVDGALGRETKLEPAVPTVSKQKYRHDGWVRWNPYPSVTKSGSIPVSVRLWATTSGVYVGVHPGFYRDGWFGEALDAVHRLVPSGASVYRVRIDLDRFTENTDPAWRGEFFVGWPIDLTTSAAEQASVIERRVADLQPVVDRLISLIAAPEHVGPPHQEAAPSPAPVVSAADHPLAEMAVRFRTERPYPSPKDEDQQAQRVWMAGLLADDAIQTVDVADLKTIFSSKRYGHPGPQPRLHHTFNTATPSELATYLDTLHFLLWGEGSDESRIDSLLAGDRYIVGLGESTIMKFLAIAHPQRYLPIFPYGGDMGKWSALKLLGLPLPEPSWSYGRRQVVANDTLRQFLEPLFPEDPWAQAQFCYWLAKHSGEQPAVEPLDIAATLSADLKLPLTFVQEILDLLDDRKQVIFYGPPGTGKTYVARAIAKAVAPDPSRRSIVQFHPSTTYEDFFEGYRPDEGPDGQLTYRLRKGPLALLAEQAENDPAAPHVMVIDELNRANLPKVFGELLFLLEYRDEPIQTLYRPDEPFTLPGNLRFIGTMNTADRSIALVDAALRRRFHFVPFFPDDDEMGDVLATWLHDEGEPAEVGTFVAWANEKLSKVLGGRDFQLGPSYFMRKGVKERLPKIWRYNIEPLIADQLFGQEQVIKRFAYTELWEEFTKANGAAAGQTEPLEYDAEPPAPAAT